LKKIGFKKVDKNKDFISYRLKKKDYKKEE